MEHLLAGEPAQQPLAGEPAQQVLVEEPAPAPTPFHLPKLLLGVLAFLAVLKGASLLRLPGPSPAISALFAWTHFQETYMRPPADPLDLVASARNLRMYKALFLAQMDQGIDARLSPHVGGFDDKTILLAMEAHMFPWLKTSSWDMFQAARAGGRGLALTTGNHHFRFAYHLLWTLRHTLHCKLPVEVFYIGENDLHPTFRAKLVADFADVAVRDLTALFDTKAAQLQGWSAKPFGVLAASFAQVIFLDADTLFLQDPAVLFENPAFAATGTVFFNDRTLAPFSTASRDWFTSFHPRWSARGRALRMWAGNSSHQLEAGCTVFDKARPAVWAGLLAVTWMNAAPQKQVVYDKLHGDKETNWMGFELVDSEYSFVPGNAGSLGFLHAEDPEFVCGPLFHTDKDGGAMWWNGGLYVNKHYAKTSPLLNFTHFMKESAGYDAEWKWETETSPFCLKSAGGPTDKVAFSGPELKLLHQISESGAAIYEEIARMEAAMFVTASQSAEDASHSVVDDKGEAMLDDPSQPALDNPLPPNITDEL